MKKKYLIFMILCLFMFNRVKADDLCSLETQVTVNNEAGAVTASASPFQYQYIDNDSEAGEDYEASAYTGVIHIYNLTKNIYAVISDGKAKTSVYYDEENPGQTSISTGDMESVKDYEISIYPVNKNCGKDAIRELNVTVPRLNRYYSYDICDEYPDYYYCSQFLSVDDISEADFTSGINEYAKTHKSASDETRKEGFLEETTTFVKKHWLIILIILIILIGGAGTFIFLKNKKRKEQIV